MKKRKPCKNRNTKEDVPKVHGKQRKDLVKPRTTKRTAYKDEDNEDSFCKSKAKKGTPVNVTTSYKSTSKT